MKLPGTSDLFARFGRDRGGAVILIFAIALIPLLGFTGVAIDYGRGFVVRTKLVGAADAAALAGVRALDSPNLADTVRDVFNANFSTGAAGVSGATHSYSVSADGKTIDLDASATVPTTLLGLLGIETIQVSASSSATRGGNPLDLVLSFDVSGSMNSSSGSGGSRLQAAKDAAAQLIAKIYGNHTVLADVRIGVVPWSTMVNVTEPGSIFTSTTASTVAQFANPVTGELQNQIHYANNTTVPLLHEPPADWKGCVYARYIDGQPEADQGDTRYGADRFGVKDWMAWEPPGSAGSESGGGGSSKKKKKKKKKSGGGSGGSDDSDCPDIGITTLRSDKTEVLTAINGLSANGWTDMAQGLVWAWRVLMPDPPFIEAVPVPDPEPYRAIIILTDGQQTGSSDDSYKGVFGTGCSAQSQLDDRLRLVAQNVKADGVKIFAIHFVTSHSGLGDLMKEIASDTGAPYYFFASDGNALTQIFETIGDQIAKLRLVK